ncbi:MAG: hypothetical protein ACFCVA_15920 [Gammaproteobacteria bacterium]
MYKGVHEDYSSPSLGLAPFGASQWLFKIAPGDFVSSRRATQLWQAQQFLKQLLSACLAVHVRYPRKLARS